MVSVLLPSQMGHLQLIANWHFHMWTNHAIQHRHNCSLVIKTEGLEVAL